ncbi:MAG: glycosyltransferase family 4 protein [Acidobacteria bacterium]|nr:glycosyltransferase family 4 protein [Acidobacteriota bacterium]
MKILHLDTGSEWRGGQQQVFWLMEGLRERGTEQWLMAPAGSPLAKRACQAGLTVAELSSPAISFANLRRLRQRLNDFDLLHVHDAHAHSLAWLGALGKTRRPAVVVARRVGFPIPLLSRPKFAAADAYIAVSRYVGRQLLDAGVSARKSHVVHDGVKLPATPIPSAERAELRRRHGISDENFLLGTLTSIAPEKLLREQIGLLSALPPSARFWLGLPKSNSQPSGEAELRKHAKVLGVERRFQIIPVENDAGNFLRSLDLFLYLSELEGLGSAILLAMAHGLPVIASRTGGIPEIVRHQETGILVDNASQAELQRAVRLLLDSPTLRQQFGAAGKQFVLAHASAAIMVAATAAVYQELLKGSDSERS